MQLRDHQQKAVDSVTQGWKSWHRQLGVAPTGAGKTILFSHLAARESGRTLILAHRDELLSQAVDKLHKATGIAASVEAGDRRALPGHGVIVASVQSMRRRLGKYDRRAFDLVICDEAHHSLSAEWQTVLSHFESARVLGVTATPDRNDRKALGSYYQNVAFEIGLLELIAQGYLCPLRAMALPVELDARKLRKKGRDVSADDAAELISPRMRELARAVADEIWDRKALIFLPRCDVSLAFARALCEEGVFTKHVQGVSDDRCEQLQWFAEPGPKALCNAMLLTEGYDCPDIDCVVILRATRSRALYCQMIGRGTRIAPGKDHLLILDPLWLSGEMDLCKPADLVAATPLHREKLQARLDAGMDIAEAEKIAQKDVEEALVEQLKEAQKNRKPPRGIIDPLAWAVGISDSDLAEYEPAMPWEMDPATESQKRELGALGLWTEFMTRGFAVRLIDRIAKRRSLNLASPKQVMLLRQLGEPNADICTKEQASQIIAAKLARAA